jgi:DNA primase
MKILNRITELYHESFITNAQPQDYLKSLGITKPEIYQAFKIGFGNVKLLKALTINGELVDQLKKIGILTKDGEELFLNCLTFPLFDADGNVVGMYGRKKGDGSKPKHYYLPGKRGIFNRQAAANSDEIILTQSITDCLLLYQNGFPNAIPLIDNTLTEDYLELFNTYRPKHIYLCLNEGETDKINGLLQSFGFMTSIIQLPENQNIYNFFKSGKSSDDFAKLIVRPVPGKTAPEGYSVVESDNGLLINCQDREYRIKGISIHLERLKVNLRAAYRNKYHIDTLDLYQSRARRYLITQLVKLFELEPNIINSDLLYIINEVEKYQAKQDEAKEQIKVYQMSRQEEEEAVKYLESADLLKNILADIENVGYIGEQSNKILAYLIAISRRLPRPLSGIIISQSGAGKSGLAEAIQELVPPEDIVFFSRISSQALYYMEKDSLKNKLLIIEEHAGGEGADYSIRTLQSKQHLSMGLPIRDANSGKIRTVTFEVEGPIAFLETTTNSELNHENLTRNFEIFLDESIEQTRRIHQLQREAKTEKGLLRKTIIEAIKLRHHNVQRVLKPVLVEIPYAPLLDFPCDSLRTRRDHERFLSLIEAITFLFQYQRQQKEIILPTGEKVTIVVSTLDDYQMAYELAKDVLDTTLDDLKKHARNLLELIKLLVDQKMEETGEITFTRREIREFCNWPDYQVKNYIGQLEDMEYLKIEKVKERGQYEYRLNNPDDRKVLKGLLSPAELQKRLSLQKTS